MWIENSRLRSPGLRALLADGEQVLTGVRCAAAPAGLERITEPPPPPEPAGQQLSGAKKVAAAAAVGVGTVVSPPASGGNAMMRLLGGIRAAGASSSIGVRLLRALDDTSNGFLVLTDRRVLLTQSDLKRTPGSTELDDVWTIDHQLERADIVAARRRARTFVVGRVELHFRDGSMVAVMTAVFSPRPARRLLRALSVPRTPPRAGGRPDRPTVG